MITIATIFFILASVLIGITFGFVLWYSVNAIQKWFLKNLNKPTK